MIPRLDIQQHDVLMRVFFYEKYYGSREKFDEDVRVFKEFFEVNGEKILNLIEKFSGYLWTKDRIPVYLIPRSPQFTFSFTNPSLEDDLPGVVQKIGLRNIRDIHIHIHELVHINQYQSDFYLSENTFAFHTEGKRNVDGMELCADLIVYFILREMFGTDSEYEKDRLDFFTNTNDKNKVKFEELNKYKDIWDLRNNSLKFYIQNT